jgi:acyl carrier protein
MQATQPLALLSSSPKPTRNTQNPSLISSSHNPSLLLVDNTLLPPYFPKMMFQKTLVAALLVASASAFAPQTPAFVTRRAAPASALFMSAELEGKVKEIIVSQLGVDADKVVNSATFVDDLGADSLDTVELIMAIEEEFDCEIPEEEAANISTVQEVIDFVLKL